MKTSIKYSSFDPETGISEVTISNLYGDFTGRAKCHPDDMSHISKYFGCEIAETRAYVKYARERRKLAKNSLKTLKVFYDTICDGKSFDVDSWQAKKLFQQMNFYQAEINKYTKIIEQIEQGIIANIKIHDDYIKEHTQGKNA